MFFTWVTKQVLLVEQEIQNFRELQSSFLFFSWVCVASIFSFLQSVLLTCCFFDFYLLAIVVFALLVLLWLWLLITPWCLQNFLLLFFPHSIPIKFQFKDQIVSEEKIFFIYKFSNQKLLYSASQTGSKFETKWPGNSKYHSYMYNQTGLEGHLYITNHYQ